MIRNFLIIIYSLSFFKIIINVALISNEGGTRDQYNQ